MPCDDEGEELRNQEIKKSKNQKIKNQESRMKGVYSWWRNGRSTNCTCTVTQ
jgi:hypothetical protein